PENQEDIQFGPWQNQRGTPVGFQPDVAMPARLDFHWHGYKYFPYERKLAEREVTSLLGQMPTQRPDGLSIACVPQWQPRAYRTTYFSHAVSNDGTVVPLQANLEESATGAEPSKGTPVLSRQSTRYSAHGLHEYRGKFNPQIVRAIGNVLGLQPGR